MPEASHKTKEPHSNATSNKDDVFQIIQNAVNRADYSELSEMITSYVDKALDQTKKGIKTGQYQMEKAFRAAKIQTTNKTPFTKKTEEKPDPLSLPAPLAKTPAGTFSGPLTAVASAATIGIGSIILISGLIGSIAIPQTVIGSIIVAGGLWLGAKAKGLMNRVKRFKQYVRSINKSHHITTAVLSENIGKPEKFVRKDVTKMIDTGMFPEGHLSEDGKTLILSDAAYLHYQNLQIAEREKADLEARRQQQIAENPIYKDIYAAEQEGEKALSEIRRIRGKTDNTAVTEKLDRLSHVIRRIFDQIKAHPDQIMSIRRFMNYYLPTTLKLLSAYEELCAQPIQGENISKAKAEIETSLDPICAAFEKLADSFYEDAAMDISSDISVMKTMMAREGLTKDVIKETK